MYPGIVHFSNFMHPIKNGFEILFRFIDPGRREMSGKRLCLFENNLNALLKRSSCRFIV